MVCLRMLNRLTKTISTGADLIGYASDSSPGQKTGETVVAFRRQQVKKRDPRKRILLSQKVFLHLSFCIEVLRDTVPTRLATYFKGLPVESVLSHG